MRDLETLNKESASPEELYLELLKKCLTRTAFGDVHVPYLPRRGNTLRRALVRGVQRMLAPARLVLARRIPLDMEKRRNGRDWPPDAETMIGLRRLDNLQACITDVLEQGVPGDLIETGAWRGGATIFMRAVLKAYDDRVRKVWVADSFRGLPRPNPAAYPEDEGDRHWQHEKLAVCLDSVKANFERYALLDDRVRFLVGWFSDTLPTAPIEQLAVLRLDADMYESTMDALRTLYPKLSVGGYIIVDDYGAVAGCRAAVEDYRREHGISEKIEPIDWSGVFWKRQ
jgi:O-methyltransferase